MTDFPRLPLRELAPAPGQVDVALRQVHHRRRRTLATAAASVTAGLVALVLLGGGDRYGTRQLEPITPVPTPSATPSAGTDDPGGAGVHLDPAPDTPSPTRPPGPRIGVPRVSALPTGSGLLVPPEPTSRYQPRHPMWHQVADSTTTSANTSWYASPGFADGTGGVGVTLYYNRGQTDDRVEVVFPGEQEAEVTVVPAGGGAALWRWGAGQRFDARRRHAVKIAPGQRGEWSTTFDGVLDDGSRLRPGDYRMWIRLLAEDTETIEAFVDFRVNEYGVAEPMPFDPAGAAPTVPAPPRSR